MAESGDGWRQASDIAMESRDDMRCYERYALTMSDEDDEMVSAVVVYSEDISDDVTLRHEREY